MNEPDLAALAIRVERLEGLNVRLQNRLKWMGRLIVGIAIAGIGTAAAWPRLVSAPRSVRAQQFVLEDGEGHVHAILDCKSGLPEPTVVDDVLEGLGYRLRPLESPGELGPSFRVYDGAGRRRITLGLTGEPRVFPLFSLGDEGGVGRFVIWTEPDGATRLELRDPAQNRRLSLHSTTDGQGQIRIDDASGKALFDAPQGGP